jgi:transglutaminase-like putative cysteine protease
MAAPPFSAFAAVNELLEPREGRLHLTPFLLPSELCDAAHSAVVGLARALVPAGASARQAAVAVHRFVREEVAYVLHRKDLRASDVASLREGMCTNKAMLQVALLRATGLPAGFVIVHITRDSFASPDFDPGLLAAIHEPTVHVFAAAYDPDSGHFLFMDATEPDVPDDVRGAGAPPPLLEDVAATGETRVRAHWLRGPWSPVQSSLDHLLTGVAPRVPRLFASGALARQNAAYRAAHARLRGLEAPPLADNDPEPLRRKRVVRAVALWVVAAVAAVVVAVRVRR